MLRQIPGWAATTGIGLFLVGYMLFHLTFDQPMNEDFSVYLQEASNIVHFKPLDDMGVIFRADPDAPLSRQGPLVYPPLLPLLFAPVVGFAGYNLRPVFLLQFAMLIAALAIF